MNRRDLEVPREVFERLQEILLPEERFVPSMEEPETLLLFTSQRSMIGIKPRAT